MSQEVIAGISRPRKVGNSYMVVLEKKRVQLGLIDPDKNYEILLREIPFREEQNEEARA